MGGGLEKAMVKKVRGGCWPKWKEVASLWQEQAVPEIEIVDWDAALYATSARWVFMDGGVLLSSNPEDDTGRHLACWLPQETSDVRVAFKLYAFCVAANADHFARSVLDPVLEGVERRPAGWWGKNAKHVLPNVKGSRACDVWRQRERYQIDDWRRFVTDATQHWRAIASAYRVLRHPVDFGVDSPEYGAFLAERQRWHELSERAQYERLRRKFEGV